MWTGIVLVLAGILLLLNNLGYLSWSFWWSLLQLWPLLLISIGLTLLLAHSRWAIIGPLLLVGAVVYALLTGAPLFPGPMGLGGQRSSSFVKEWEQGLESGRLELEVGAASLKLREVNEAEDKLVTGEFRGGSYQPSWKYKRRKNEAMVEISASRLRTGRIINHRGFDAKIALSAKIPWDIDIELGAGELEADLSRLRLQRLSVDMGAGKAGITLPDSGRPVRVDIDTGASSLWVKVPRSVGLQVMLVNSVGSNNLADAGLIKQGDYWVTQNYKQAPSAYVITVHSGVGEFRLERSAASPQI